MPEIYAYNPKGKNTRWPFPTLHVFTGDAQRYSACGKVARDDERLVFTEDYPKNRLVTICEKCVHSRPTLRARLYGKEA